MKQKLKTIKLLLTIFLVGLLLFSCSAENDLIENDLNKQNTGVNHRKFEDLIKQEGFRKAILKVPKKKKGTASTNTNGKTVMEQQYGFTISNELVNEINKDSIVSYTIHIVRDNSLPNELENLVVQVYNQNLIKSWIIKYTNDVQITSENLNATIQQSQKTIEPIVYNDTPISQGLLDAGCYDSAIWICSYPGHTSTGTCTQGGWQIISICGGGGGVGNSSSTGNSSGGGVSTATVYVDPNIGKLNTITNGAIVSPKMNDLKNRITANVEHAYVFTANSAGTLVPSSLIVGILDRLDLPPVQINTKVIIHVHHNGLEPIPTIGDIANFAQTYNNKVNLGATDAQDITSIIMSKAGNYAFRVNSPVALQNFLSYYKDPEKKNTKGQTYKAYVDEKFKNVSERANDLCNGCSIEQHDAILESLFSKLLKNLDTGIGLYHSMPKSPANPTYSWTIVN
ncbi:hypothetical protein [Flavobacterium sp.]|uniref:hypothetical protein n=1 Tax=Flavobacterium sp. TaxID=239 RepID=UPI00374D02FD